MNNALSLLFRPFCLWMFPPHLQTLGQRSVSCCYIHLYWRESIQRICTHGINANWPSASYHESNPNPLYHENVYSKSRTLLAYLDELSFTIYEFGLIGSGLEQQLMHPILLSLQAARLAILPIFSLFLIMIGAVAGNIVGRLVCLSFRGDIYVQLFRGNHILCLSPL